MMLMLADKITNLSSARYFAARGFDWLFYSLSEGVSMSIPKLAAIREWVEGPSTGIYLPLGFRPEEDQPLADLLPEGWMIGHFGGMGELPPYGTLFKEWIPESSDHATELAAAMAAWPADTHHLLRISSLAPDQQLQVISSIRYEAPDILLIPEIGNSAAVLHEVLDMSQGICVLSPDEFQTGLMSFEVLDEVLDRVESLRG